MIWLLWLQVVEAPCAFLGLVVVLLWLWETITYLTVEMRWQRQRRKEQQMIKKENT